MVGVSTGLEPYFSFSYFRSGRLGKFIEVNAAIVDQWLALNPGYTRRYAAGVLRQRDGADARKNTPIPNV